MIGSDWNIPNKSGVVVLLAGAVIGFVFFIAMFLQDTEAIVFVPAVSGDENLRSMSCPEILTKDEVGVVKAHISNRTGQILYRTVRAHVSQGYLSLDNRITDHYDQQPGEKTPLTWEVHPSDAAWGYVTMVKVHVLEQAPYPSYVGTCGIVWLDLPYVQGWHLVAAVWIVSVALMSLGLWRYRHANDPLVGRRRKLFNNLRVVMVTVMLAMGSLFVELWYLEMVFFIFTMILLAESIFTISQS